MQNWPTAKWKMRLCSSVWWTSRSCSRCHKNLCSDAYWKKWNGSTRSRSHFSQGEIGNWRGGSRGCTPFSKMCTCCCYAAQIPSTHCATTVFGIVPLARRCVAHITGGSSMPYRTLFATPVKTVCSNDNNADYEKKKSFSFGKYDAFQCINPSFWKFCENLRHSIKI